MVCSPIRSFHQVLASSQEPLQYDVLFGGTLKPHSQQLIHKHPLHGAGILVSKPMASRGSSIQTGQAILKF